MKARVPTKTALKYCLEYFNYDQHTGDITWKKAPGLKKIQSYRIGTIAGTVSNRGYRMVKFQEGLMTGHRLAWFLHYKKYPPCDGTELDHINGDRSDNRIKNLRLVSRSMNQRNRKEHRNNRKEVGVIYNKRDKRWQATRPVVCENKKYRKQKFLGFFDTKEEAIKRVQLALKGVNLPNPKRPDWRTLKQTPIYGENHTQAKLDNQKVLKIIKLLNSKKLSQLEISKQFNVGQVAISQIKLGRTWKHLSRELNEKAKI